MPRLKLKAIHDYNLNSGRIWAALIFIGAFFTSAFGKTLSTENSKDSISIQEESKTTFSSVSGKIYVVKGTLTSGIDESSSAEIVYIQEKKHTNKPPKQKVAAQKEKSKAPEKLAEKPKEKEIVYLQPGNQAPISFLYHSGGKISSVLPVSSSFFKPVFSKSVTIQKDLLAFAVNQNIQKIRIPSFDWTEESQFKTGSWAVRPPPSTSELTT